jgi:hypothetical protein
VHTKAKRNWQLAYRLAVDFVVAVGAVLRCGDLVFLELLVDELRAADVRPVHAC